MRSIFITGGTGFIGSNAADYFSKKKWKVFIYDNLSRNGSNYNLSWLLKKVNIKFIKGDIRNYELLKKTLKKIKPEVILHCAGQVAVTTSFTNPREDFEINAKGTFNILEATKNNKLKSKIIYTSTNKVYGDLPEHKLKEKKKRYSFFNNHKGVNEKTNIDFHSPYGCSKGAADQYVMDYSREYKLDTFVLRQSCIYGPNQFGIEDQGWLAWFTIASILKKKITIFGNGKQVRDLLHVNDLIRLFEVIANNKNKITSRIYNVGGGLKFSLSILELLDLLESLMKKKIPVRFSKWRPGDQKIYISDNSKTLKNLGWKPKIDPKKGVTELINWVLENKKQIKKILN